MKSFAAALAFILAPAPALAQATSGDRDAVCYSWLSQTPAGVMKLLRADLLSFIEAEQLPKPQRPRFVSCVRGTVQALVPAVRTECIGGGDPASLISAAFADVAFACAEQSANPPTAIFPEVELDPEAGATPRRRGLGR